MGKKVVLYEWPESQICISCPLSVFTDPDGDKVGSSAYICIGNKTQGKDCIPFERMGKGEVDEDSIYNDLESDNSIIEPILKDIVNSVNDSKDLI